MDQAAFENPEFLGAKRKCSEDTGLDSNLDLYHRGDREKEIESLSVIV
jgi:hypothetical protein